MLKLIFLTLRISHRISKMQVVFPEFDIVVYHGGCPDGIVSAWITAKCAEMQNRNIALVSYRHGQSLILDGDKFTYWQPKEFSKPPKETCGSKIIKKVFSNWISNNDENTISFVGMRVLMVDISLPRKDMEYIKSKASSFTCLDHHESAERELYGLDYCVFDMSKCGSSLTWNYCFGPIREPWFLKYVNDRDIWAKQFVEQTATFHSYMTYYEYAYGTLNVVEISDPDMILSEGTFYRKLELKDINEAAGNAKICTFTTPNGDKYKVAACGSVKWGIVSDVGNAMAIMHDCDFAVIYNYDLEEDKWTLSIRGIEGKSPNLSKVAEQFIYKNKKCGGHPCAAGIAIPNTADESLKKYLQIIKKI